MARPDADNARAGAVGRRTHARSHGRLVGGRPAPHDPSGAAAQPLSLLRALCGRLVAADVQAQEGDAGADFWVGAFPAELGRGRKEMFCVVLCIARVRPARRPVPRRAQCAGGACSSPRPRARPSGPVNAIRNFTQAHVLNLIIALLRALGPCWLLIARAFLLELGLFPAPIALHAQGPKAALDPRD